MDELHRDSYRVIHQSSNHSKSGSGKEQWNQKIPCSVSDTRPPSATQVAKRTSVLRKLTRTSLSEGRMSGMCPCGQWVHEPVIWLVLLPESGNKGIPVHLSPFWGSPWTWTEEFLPQELWFWPPGQPVGDHPRPNISALTLSKGFIFWFVISYWAYFAIERWHQLLGMSVSSLIFPTLLGA